MEVFSLCKRVEAFWAGVVLLSIGWNESLFYEFSTKSSVEMDDNQPNHSKIDAAKIPSWVKHLVKGTFTVCQIDQEKNKTMVSFVIFWKLYPGLVLHLRNLLSIIPFRRKCISWKIIEWARVHELLILKAKYQFSFPTPMVSTLSKSLVLRRGGVIVEA